MAIKVLCLLTIMTIIMLIISLYRLHKARIAYVKISSATDKLEKQLEHPIFQLSLSELEHYLSEIYIRKMVYIIRLDISSMDPNGKEEIYARTLIAFLSEFSDIQETFDKKMGKNYLLNFARNINNQMLLDGQIDKLIKRYSV